MAILVTGGAGYIGSHIALRLRERNEPVVVLDNLTTGFRQAVPEGCEFVFGDAGAPGLLDRIISDFTIDAVMHVAGSAVLPDSVSDPLAYYRNNTSASRTLIEACVRHNVRHFIFSSTAAVYGIPKLNPVSEAAEPHPASPYGRSKLMTEWMLADTAHAHKFRYAALRYFNVAGADPEMRTGQSTARATNLIKAAVRAAIGAAPQLTIYGTDYPTPDGTGVRDFIHVMDLADAHLRALDALRGGYAGGVLNVGYGRGYSVLDVVKAVEAEAGTRIAIRTAPRRPGDLAEVIADATRIREEIGWTPRFNDLRTIVRHALAWERHLQHLNMPELLSAIGAR